jgi:hypothetical protein
MRQRQRGSRNPGEVECEYRANCSQIDSAYMRVKDEGCKSIDDGQDN